MQKVILHSDANAYYASVELLHRPTLRSSPVVVGGSEESRHGIVLAKNELAKGMGIKTGVSLAEARQHCPGLITLPPNYHLYLKYAGLLREIYSEYTDKTEAFGLDESWLDLSPIATAPGDGEHFADEIRRRVRQELGITVSIGVSFNKIFAKLGSDMRKPDFVTAIGQENYRETVWPLPVSELLYVGPATTRKLRARSIRTVGDLARRPRPDIHRMLGKVGDMIWTFANGYDQTPVMDTGVESAIKSVGNSSTFPRDLVNNEDMKMGFFVLAESVAARLREHGLKCQTVQISLRDNSLFTFERQKKLRQPTALASELAEAAMELFIGSYDWRRPLRSIGIRGCELVAANTDLQLSIFVNDEQRRRREALEGTVDILRDRYGYFSIQRCLLLKDGRLTNLDAKGENTIHPVGYLYTG